MATDPGFIPPDTAHLGFHMLVILSRTQLDDLLLQNDHPTNKLAATLRHPATVIPFINDRIRNNTSYHPHYFPSKTEVHNYTSDEKKAWFDNISPQNEAIALAWMGLPETANADAFAAGDAHKANVLISVTSREPEYNAAWTALEVASLPGVIRRVWTHTPPTVRPHMHPAMPKVKSRWPLILFLGGLALFVCCGCFLIMITGGNMFLITVSDLIQEAATATALP